ncbi:hypothetical protein [Pseudomonas sp. 44 R 15]|nr:hypothetical protein [Pseudomonas sp. 44 R 15]
MPDLHKTHCLNAVKTVGGGLPPMAVGQSQIYQLTHRYRGQAPSHIGLHFNIGMGGTGWPLPRPSSIECLTCTKPTA